MLCFAMLFFFKNSGGIKRSTKVILVIIGVVMISGYGYKLNMDRYTFTDVGSDYNVTSEQGRLGIWKKGIILVLTHPLTGVGVNCFGNAIGDLRGELGEKPKWQAPHNSYVQVAAETGIIGLFLFYSLIIRSFRNIKRVFASSSESISINELKAISSSVRFGFIASVVAAFFLSEAYTIVFTLFFALAAVIRKLSIDQLDQSSVKN